jgi:hypothetical protein
MKTSFDEKGKIFTEVVRKRPVNVHVQTSKHLIRGKFHVRLNERIKDELDRSETFIALTEAEIYDSKGGVIYQCRFLSVNRLDIVWLFQDNDLENDGEGA